ncbi:hypothetical protein ACFQY8_04605 [Alloscardovia venturai]|uniref:Uncharacterized protein n=1 Tax=Alloscardovia venturai TaxID=1769421 RepID=A0ABW2Y448_9BIFI
MANRAERRAEAKRQRRGQDQSQQGNIRSRAGLLDEQSLQDRSLRLQSKSKGEWKPSSSVQQHEVGSEIIPSADPTVTAVSAEKKEIKKERKLRERARKQLEREEVQREKEAAERTRVPRFAHSPRWWGSLSSWIVAGLSVVSMIVMAVLKAPAWSYSIPVIVLVISLIVLAVIARSEPTNYYDQLAQLDRMDDIRQVQLSAYRKPAAHNLGWWVRLLNWGIIILAGCGFISFLFWTPGIWVISGVVIVFAVGILNLFIVSRPSSENPHLDQYGTAI